MHGLGVFHRDIKLENSKILKRRNTRCGTNALHLVMVHQDGTLKIADFGWAVYDPRPR